jgi:hypothetical protein
VTGVGGSEFDEERNYWNTTNGANNTTAVSYIPERA